MNERKIKLKVCGMREEENIRQVAALNPDFMGFILYSRSPRYVGENYRMPRLSAAIKKTGVFVNESTDIILKRTGSLGLDYVQLHGDETVEQCDELRKHNLKIIKVFSVDDQFDFEVTKPYRERADFFLFDTKGKYYGGNSVAFNWNILEKYDQQVPFFLSGGIGPENAGSINSIKDMNLYALDINSGVEISPALKDPDKVNRVKEILSEQ